MSVSRRLLAVAGAAVVLLAGCGTDAAQPREGRAGLQLSGTVDGRQLAVSDGSPRLLVGDCGPGRTGSEDVCVISRDLNGRLVVLVVKNPGVLEEGASVEVADADCEDPAVCDEVTEAAVVDLQLADDRQRADSGTVTMTTVEERRRYAGTVRLTLPGGRVSGEFDVVPRPD